MCLLVGAVDGSMTMRAIVGLTSVTGGEVVFTGETGKTYTTTTASGKELRRARRNIGMIFQGCNLVRHLPVLDNVMIGRLGRIHPLRSWLYGFTDGEASEAMSALDRVGMADFASRVTGSLSGDEMQRVAIARAIVSDPTLLLADEPTGDLDSHSATEVLEILKRLNEDFHKTVIMVTHDPHAASYAHVTRHLEKGMLLPPG